MKYRKILFFIIVFAVIYLIYFLYHDKTISYVALGDAYAMGENPYGEVGLGYTDYFIDEISKNKKVKLYTKDFSKKNYYVHELYEDIVSNKNILINDKTLSLKNALREADIITLSIGADDIMSKVSFNDVNKLSNEKIVKETIDDINKLLNEVLKYNNCILIVGYYNFYMNKNDNNVFSLLNNELKNLTNRKSIEYIDTYSLIDNKYLENPNSFYPNTKAYQLISDEIIKHLKKT